MVMPLPIEPLETHLFAVFFYHLLLSLLTNAISSIKLNFQEIRKNNVFISHFWFIIIKYDAKCSSWICTDFNLWQISIIEMLQAKWIVNEKNRAKRQICTKKMCHRCNCMNFGIFFHVFIYFSTLLTGWIYVSAHLLVIAGYAQNVFYRVFVAWSLIFQLVLLVKWYLNRIA